MAIAVVHRVTGRFQVRLSYLNLQSDEVKNVLDALSDDKIYHILSTCYIRVHSIHTNTSVIRENRTVVTDIEFDAPNRTTCDWEDIDNELENDSEILLKIADRIEELTGIG